MNVEPIPLEEVEAVDPASLELRDLRLGGPHLGLHVIYGPHTYPHLPLESL